MKKLCLIIFMFCNLFFLTFADNVKSNKTIEIGEYSYPYKEPNVATIVGSSMMMKDGVTSVEKINKKEYSIDIKENVEIPESLWYEKGYKFSLVKQNKKSPLIFIIAGTGATHDSSRMEFFQRIFYDAGYNVISIASPIQMNFIINASTSRMPGVLMEDSKDIYNVMNKAYDKVKDKIQVSDVYLMGYSLGAAQSAFVSYIDETEKKFNFKRVYMINPVVDLKKSANKLDQILDRNIKGDNKKIGNLIDEILSGLAEQIKKDQRGVNEEAIFQLFKDDHMTKEKKESIIGFVFRMISVDTNYVTDLLNKRGVYVGEEVGKFDSMFKYFERINFANFISYLDKLLMPYYEEKGFTKEQLLNKVTIYELENYLKNTNKIAVITNKDEIILDNADIKYLENVFGNRMILFPYGGHCGNMYYKPNVDTMLKYLQEGKLEYAE
ncbi:MAG: serine/threonine protein kinase [Fusobacteriaceae bacterium]